QVRAERALSADAPIKVAALGARLPPTADYLTSLANTLEFNKGVKAKDQPTNYREFNPIYTPTSDPDYYAVAQAVVAFAPDVVVTTEARSFHLWFLPLIEALWPSARTYRPKYATTENAAFPARYANSVGGNDALRKRVGGAWPALDPASQPVFDDL